MTRLEGGQFRFLTLPVPLWLAAGAVLTFLFVYSQTLAWTSDESFHLLAALSVNAGHTPYLDFFYQHPPLYVYLTAAWMRLFGETWRSVHVMSALLTMAGIVLVADFLFSRLPHDSWRLGATGAAMLLAGLERQTLKVGVVAQQYGLCIFLLALAFRLAIASVDRRRGFLPVWAGVCAGAAAASNLLVAPAAPILLIWLLHESEPDTRRRQSVRYLAGTVIPFIPLLWLFARASRHVYFNVVEYHLRYRREENLDAGWTTFKIDANTLTSWTDASQPVLLISLAALGLAFITGPDWPRRTRSEFLLCLWLAAGLALVAAGAHPTFPAYFVTTLPFLGVLAGVGLYAVASRIWAPRRGHAVFLALAFLYVMTPLKMIVPLKALYRDPSSLEWTWRYYEALAKKVQELTPKDSRVYATRQHFFVASRRPFLPGRESYHVGKLPAHRAESLGYGSEDRLRQHVLAGHFATIVIWPDEDKRLFEELMSTDLYARREGWGEAQIFWDKR